MTPLFPAQRVAEEFDRVLDGTASRAVADRHAGLLQTADVLRSHRPVDPRPEFVTTLRERLMTAADTELARTPTVVRPPREAPVRRPARRAGTLAATLVILGGSAGMAAAASGSLPGEALYPIKRGMEQVTTALQLGDAAEGASLLGQAENRLDEIGALLAAGDADPAVVAATVDSFRSSAGDGADKLFVAYQRNADPADIETVRTFTTEQMGVLNALVDGSDAGTASVLVDAADTLADIDQQARVLCGACGPDAAVAPPEALGAGALAPSMDNLIVRPVVQAQVDAVSAELRRLQQAAEEQASQTPMTTTPPGTGVEAAQPARSGPVRSVISKSGERLPAFGSDAPVKDLLTGATGTLEGVPSSVSETTKTLQETTKKLTETVDGLSGNLKDTLGGTTGSLLP